jgi:EAL domain-containing protein (putative c-di-GMP-specific phosphodiesterase class I)
MERGLRVVSVETVGKRANRSIALDLGRAIARQEIEVYFQPQFEIATGHCCGVEALARWRGAHGETPPSTFIPIAEHVGLIGAIGVSVLYQSCIAVREWNCAQADRPPTLSVNVSARQITRDFCGVLENILEITRFPAQRLQLEITESTLMKDPEAAVQILQVCRDLGVQVALDDFGTGYSSLSYLSRLPIDRLKLDKSFVQHMVEGPRDAAIVQAVISLGAEIGVPVTAEGVESEKQLHLLEVMGCAEAQGNLLAPPLPAEQAQELISLPFGRFAASSGKEGGGRHAA